MTNAKRLFFNTILLTSTAFIMRTVLVSFNAYLTNKIGADGIGLFQLISAVYIMATTFSIAGIKLASMRLVADNSVSGRFSQRQIVSRCLLYAVLCGTAVAMLLSAFSTVVAGKWIGDMRSVSSLKVLSISLPFASMSAALDGYFTSVGKIGRYTVVQFAEQIFKIAVTVFSFKSVLSHGLEASCVAIVFGITTGEIFSLLCSFLLYRLSSQGKKTDSETKAVWRELLRISIPDCIGADIRSVLMTIEHLLVPIGFRKAGYDSASALSTYGVIHGMALPLVLYPSALLSSLSGLLVPEITKLHTEKSDYRIHYMVARVLHLTLLFSIGTAGIMYFNAPKLALAVYNNENAGVYMQIFAPLIPVMYMDMSVDGMLKGLDQQVSYMRYNIIDASICVVLVYFLIPRYSVRGYIIVVFVSELINFALSFNRLTVVTQVKISLFKDVIIPCLCVVCTGLLKNIISVFVFNNSNCVYDITFSVLLYVLMLVVFNAIDSEERVWFKNFLKIKSV